MSLKPLTADTQRFLDASPHKLLIDGEWVDAASGETFASINPSDGTHLADLASAGPEDVDRAVAAARRALDGPWSKITPAQREAMLRQLGDLITVHAAQLAELESLDNGKPIHHTQAIDAPAAAKRVYHAAGWSGKIEGHTVPVSIPNHFVYTRREPVGVVGIIIPWNYPLIHSMQKIAPALACGNTVVFKPSPWASVALVRLGQLIQEAGFPPGVANILTEPEIAAGVALAEHPDVDKIAATGSVGMGRSVIHASAVNFKRLSLELGNKAANIIFADADLEAAVSSAFKAAFGNTGQSCVAGARLYVQAPIFNQVVDGLLEMTKGIKIGHALNPDTTIGPIVNQIQMDKILGYIQGGLEQGATLVCGGEQLTDGEYANGFYLAPTIFTNVRDDMTIAREEIFGPVVSTFSFETEEEVVARANDTEYGLAAGIWTRDVARAHRVSEALKTGVVWVNTYDMFDSAAPFGGFKGSGYGRDNGPEIIETYTEVKAVWVSTK
jgi:acyl-CoA reductase-like NAD-dependent aldehyde dehydrogenase